MRWLFALSLLASCQYQTDPRRDPADPIVFSLYNTSAQTAYLRLAPDGSPLGAALLLDTLQVTPGCDGLCSDGCVAACTGAGRVRALAAGEAIVVSWNMVAYGEGSQSCAGTSRLCWDSAGRVPKGRYRATLCFGRSVQPIDLNQAIVRDDLGALRNATTPDDECRTIEVAVPEIDVHWAIVI
jgi:hypothetical protein